MSERLEDSGVCELEAVSKYLNRYCDSAVYPQFAVMISGKWGSGKTFFIKSWKKEREEADEDSQVLYVSLYGLRTTADVDAEFFRLLHPTLSNPKLRVVGKVLKGLLKTSLQIDLNGDGTSDGVLRSEIPDFELGKGKLPEKTTVVFDDLERCRMKLDAIMGYINSFVEHEGLRVVVCANEEEFGSRGGREQKKYRSVREKLIGKTLKVSVPAEVVIHDTIEQFKTSNPKLVSALLLDLDFFVQVFECSGFQNFRLLKTGLFELSEIVEGFEDSYWEHEEFVRSFVGNFMVQHLELESGSLTRAELFEASSMHNPEGKAVSTAYEKYKGISEVVEPWGSGPAFYSPLRGDEWRKIFEPGSTNIEWLSERLKKSSYFTTLYEPDWVKLWRFSGLESKDFDVLVEKVRNRFFSSEIEGVPEVIQVVGIFLRLIEVDLVQELTPANLLLHGKSEINRLFEEGNVDSSIDWEDDFRGDGTGYMPHCKEGDEITELQKFCNQEKGRLLIKAREDDVSKVLDALSRGETSWIHQLSSNSGAAFGKGFMAQLPLVEFTAGLKKLVPGNRRIFFHALESRYDFSNCWEWLGTEMKWLQDLRTKMDEMKGEAGHPLMQLQLSHCKDFVSRAIEKLEKSRERE